MLPASIVAQGFLHCEMLFVKSLIDKVMLNDMVEHIDISCVGRSQLSLLFCTLKSGYFKMFSGTVEQCSTLCIFCTVVYTVLFTAEQ